MSCTKTVNFRTGSVDHGVCHVRKTVNPLAGPESQAGFILQLLKGTDIFLDNHPAVCVPLQ